LADISKIVEAHLDSKYLQIQNNKLNQENASKEDEIRKDKSTIETAI